MATATTQASPTRSATAPEGSPVTSEKKFASCRHCGRTIYRWTDTANSSWFHAGTSMRFCETNDKGGTP